MMKKTITIKLKAFLCTIIFLICTQNAFSHAVQIAYCILPTGELRVYLEHWHGNQTAASITQSVLNMNITVGGTTTAISTAGSGFINSQTINNLPGCTAAIQVAYACTANELICCRTTGANTFNNWIYFDFPPPGCEEPITIEIINATDPTFTLVEGCNNLFPSTITETFEDMLPPTIACPTDLAVQCDDDVPNRYGNYTQFIVAGGTAVDNCEVTDYQFISETIE